ncbi:hypothetical protein COCOBI_10-3120 [Coccomyxa sp. Obi]|nr:hypothetical protein COCOBI_10-3120 [Coccomyxa sp. Obi]
MNLLCDRCHEALEVLGTVLSEERFLKLCSESDEERAFLALLDALATASDKKTAKLALWGLSRQQIPTALIVPHLERVLGQVGPYLTPTREPSRHAVCSVYAVHTVSKLAEDIPDGMRQHAEVWGPPLWRLTLAEPQGSDYWLEKKQWEMKLLRDQAADGLKQAMPLLMSRDGVLAALAPLQRMLICDMTGDSTMTARPDSPVQRSPAISRATTPTSIEVAHLEPPEVSLARMPSTTVPCSTSGEEAGLVGVLCRMFEGRAPPEAVAAQAAAAEGNNAASAGLPEDLNRCRRTAALRTLPLLFQLLGGNGITWKGVHRPIMKKIFSKAFESNEEKVVSAAFECWHVLIDALTDIKYLHKGKILQATMVNPIAVMLRKSSPSIKKMMESLHKLTRPDIILLVTEELAGASFLRKLASTLTKHPELTSSCLQSCLSCLIAPWFTHAISVLKASLPARQEGIQWPKVLMQFYTSTINLPGMFTNADCQQTSISAVLHMFGQLASMLAQYQLEGEYMAEVNEKLDTLLARLTPAMLSCCLPSLHVDITQNSAGSSSETGKEQTMSALSYLLHWWILLTLLAPPAHTANCLEKMQILLTAVDQSPMPVLHLQHLLKSLKHHLNETAKVRFISTEKTGQGQNIGEHDGTFGTTATVLCTLAAHSLGYNLANTEEFDNSSEAAASALQHACTALMLSFKFWDGLASRAAAATGMQSRAATATKQKHSSCADNESGSQQPAKDLQEPHSPSCNGSPNAEAATCTATGHASAASDRSAERLPGVQQAECLPNSTAAEFEQAWKSMLGSVLSVASRKRSFKKEICGEIARRICAIAERLPVNGMALVCLQLASSASNTLAHQVQKSQPGKLIVEAAQLRRERLDVLKLLGVVLQQLVKHVEQNIPLAAACNAQVLKAVAGLLKHNWEDFKVLDILKLLLDPMGALLKHTGASSPASIGEPLQSCWIEVLNVLVAQERPGQSLASALSQRPSCTTEMLQPLCYGFTHSCARIRAASLELWNDPKLQCVLGKHLAGLPPNVQQALARGAELGFASQLSQPAAKPPHKPPPILPRMALPAPIVAPPAAEQNGHQQQQHQRGLATAGGTAHVEDPRKRPAARLFQDTQTEYVRIDTASKRPRKDLLTDHQKEVAARHRQGTGREGIITHTRLDVSQDALSLLKASGSVPDSEGLDSPVVIDNKGPVAAHDGGVGEPVMHSGPFTGQETSQDAPIHSRAAEESQMPSSAARAQIVLEPKRETDGAAVDEVIHDQQDCSSAQKAGLVTHEDTEDGADQQGCMLQEAPAEATSSQAAAEGVEVCQLHGRSAIPDGPKADSTSAGGAHVLCAPQAPSKGKENSDSQQQHPQQQPQWRKKRTSAQMAHHSLSPPRRPEAQSGPAASKASQRSVAVSPDVVAFSDDAPVSAGAANGTAENPASQGQHAVSGWQPTSGQREVQCAQNAVNRLDTTMTEAVHDSDASAVPVDAQTADVGGHCEHHMLPNTVPESCNADEDVDVVQIDGPADEHVWGEQNVVMTSAAIGTIPQTLLQTCALGTVPNTACTAIPAPAIEPLLFSAGPPAQTQVGFVLPEANEVGAHQQEQPLGARAPVSEADVQELQLTGLTQQLGQVARPGKQMAGTTLNRLQTAITAAVEEALEVGTRTGSLQQLDALQQVLIKAAAQIGEERIRRSTL